MPKAGTKKKSPLKFEPYSEADWGDAWYCIGDVHEQLALQADASVDLVMTSPPFLALRSYLPADHPDKAREIGQEGTPGAFLDAMLDVVEELGRVLTPHGSIVIELGDTYSGSGGAGGDYNAGGMRDGAAKFSGSESKRRDAKFARRDDESLRKYAAGKRDGKFSPDWPAAKCKTLIPELFAVALAYGFNPLTGRETEPWLVRNVVAWCRPNPPVGALGDKFRPATSYLTIATKNPKRYFDLDAVRYAADPANKRPSALVREGIPGRTDQVANPLGEDGQRIIANPAGAPPLDWWEVTTQPYSGSHYAVMPETLCVRPILSMAPERVCSTCGVPSTRIVPKPEPASDDRVRDPERLADSGGERHGDRVTNATTTGWTDCGHNDWRRGLVLDPFAGSGTTLKVATMLGRDAIGFDLDARNAALASERIPAGHLFIEGAE